LLAPVANDPGCVKTPKFNLRIEISSRLRQFEKQKRWRPLSKEDNRANNSAHSSRADVFTQPRPEGDSPGLQLLHCERLAGLCGGPQCAHAVWTGDARDTRPKRDDARRFPAAYARGDLCAGRPWQRSRHRKLATAQRPEWLERKPRALNLNVLRGRNANGGYHNLIVAQHRICPNCAALKPKLT